MGLAETGTRGWLEVQTKCKHPTIKVQRSTVYAPELLYGAYTVAGTKNSVGTDIGISVPTLAMILHATLGNGVKTIQINVLA